MKILLMGFQKLAYMPFMNFYLSQLDLVNNDVHLLYWNRNNQPEKRPDYPITYHEFVQYQEDEVPKITKINSFLKYRKTALKLIEQEKFDLIIVLHTGPGFLLQDVLWKKYAKKFIFDYRDFTLESNFIYKYLIGLIVKKSIVTFVSSDGYRQFLPNCNHIHTSHNLLLDSLQFRNIRRASTRIKNPIRVRFWGMVRQESINRTIIDRLANDERFELHYHGRLERSGENLEKYCAKKQIKNVIFHGTYSPNERYSFAKETEILHNLYENDDVMVNSMTNKFYDGIIHYIPLLCNKGSFMGQRVIREQIGIELDPHDPSFADSLYNYYQAISWDDFHSNCDASLKEILTEYHAGNQIIDQTVNQNERGQIKRLAP